MPSLTMRDLVEPVPSVAAHRNGTEKRVVFVRYWGSHFKSCRQANNLAGQFAPLVQRNWHCHLVVERLPEERSWLEPFRALNVRFVVLPRPKGNFDFRCVARAYSLCKRTQCDVFHCDNMHTSPLIGAFLAGVAVRVWYKRSMSAHFEECRVPGWRERLAVSTRLSCFLATRVIAISSAVRDELTGLGISRARITVLNNPRPTLKTVSLSRTQARRQFGYDDSSVVLVSIGRAVPTKGWDVLLHAFARVAAADEHARLLLVGSTTATTERAFFERLKSVLDTYRLGERVQFGGYVADIGNALAAGDVFVLPSRSEGCCNALLEALESGLPCVATRVGNAEELIKDGWNGFLVERNEPEPMANALLLLTRDHNNRKELARSAKIPDQVLTRVQHSEHLASIYESLLLNGRHHQHEIVTTNL
jgi:glycosyltransferase involved in cell wall biosynthesis